MPDCEHMHAMPSYEHVHAVHYVFALSKMHGRQSQCLVLAMSPHDRDRRPIRIDERLHGHFRHIRSEAGAMTAK